MNPSRRPRIVIEDLPSLETLTPEERERIFGAGREPTARLGLERLEGREMPAVDVTSVLTGGVLRVVGTDQGDKILLRQYPTLNRLEVLSGTQVIGSYDSRKISGIEVVGLGGDDTIDLTGGGRPVLLTSRLYGGIGTDKLYGGAGVDYLFGGEGDDTLSGNAGADVLYGDLGTNTLIGGLGGDYLSYGPGVRAKALGAGDVDIEALSYAQQARFDLLNRFRDAYGYVVEVTESGQGGKGDATLKTALAAISTALATNKAPVGDLATLNAATKSFLNTILRHSWDAAGNPIRHPTLSYYDASGTALGLRPLSRDPFGSILAACYYAYASPRTTADVKAVAKQLIGKYVNYFVGHQFRMVSQMTLQQLEGPVYSREDDGKLTKQMKEGVDVFLLLPTEIYALQNVAAKMGFATAGWNPWANFGSGVTQILADYLAEYLAHGKDLPPDAAIAGSAVLAPGAGALAYFIDRGGLDGVLKQAQFTLPYSLTIGGVKLVSGNLSLALPAAARTALVDAFKTVIRESIRAGNLTTLELPAVVGQMVDRAFAQLPPLLGKDQWKAVLTSTLQDVVPWLTGANLTTAATFIFSTELLRYQYGENKGAPTLIDGLSVAATTALSTALLGFPIPRTAGGEQGGRNHWFAVHLGFWPTLLIQETRPEMVEMLTPFVRLLQNSIAKHENGPWAFLSRDTGKVNDLLARFRTGAFDRVSYALELPIEERTRQATGGEPNHHARLDYLILQGLTDRGTPAGLGKTVADWKNRWVDALRGQIAAMQQAINNLRNNLVQLAKELYTHYRLGLSEVAKVLWGVKQDLAGVAGALWAVKADAVAVFRAIALPEGANRGLVSAVRGLVGARVIENGSLQVGRFLVNDVKLELGDVAQTVYDWVSGTAAEKLKYAFWAIAGSGGANKGLVAGVQGLVGSPGKLLTNGSLAVGGFLVNTAGVGWSDAAQTVYDWVNGTAAEKLRYAFWAIAGSGGANKGFVAGVQALVGSPGKLLANGSLQVGAFLANNVGLGLGDVAQTVYNWVHGTAAEKLKYAFWAIAGSNGAGKGYLAGVQALVGSPGKLLANGSLQVGAFLANNVGLGLGDVARTVYDWVSGTAAEKLKYAFWAIAGSAGAGKGFVAGVQGMVGAKLVTNGSLQVGAFLANTVGMGFGDVARTVYDWVSGSGAEKLRYAFWALAGSSGAGKGFVAGVQGMIGANLVTNGSLAVGAFLANTVGLGFSDVVRTVYDWVGGSAGDKLRYAFWALAGSSGAGKGYLAGVQGLVGAGLVANGSMQVGAFLANNIKLGLGDVAQTVYDWVGGSVGDKLRYAFWAIADSAGAGKGFVAAVQGLVWSPRGLLANDSYAVGKFLLHNVRLGLADTARTISDWLGGDRVAAFWAIVHPNAADFSYADGIRGLIGADLLGGGYGAVSSFLYSQLSWSDATRVLNDLF